MVCVLGAWNYPVQLTLMPLVGAVAAGNCVMVRLPSSNFTYHTTQCLASLAADHLDMSAIRFFEGMHGYLSVCLCVCLSSLVSRLYLSNFSFLTNYCILPSIGYRYMI